jgi:hypothetical protein
MKPEVHEDYNRFGHADYVLVGDLIRALSEFPADMPVACDQGEGVAAWGPRVIPSNRAYEEVKPEEAEWLLL